VYFEQLARNCLHVKQLSTENSPDFQCRLSEMPWYSYLSFQEPLNLLAQDLEWDLDRNSQAKATQKVSSFSFF
jgi:hypothetical protein